MVASTANAEWCTFEPGFLVTTHGNQSDKVWVNGTIEGEGTNRWVELSDGTSGSKNVAIALAAQASDRPLGIFLHDTTCGQLPDWYTNLRHVRML